jgi:hypothetical protein
MNTRNLILGAAVGAGLGYMLDPQSGRRRRALARDQMVRASHKTIDALDATGRDMAHRARGIAAATRGRFANEFVDDYTLIERVRAKLGRVCSHPRAIHVEVTGGHVTLRGPILRREMDDVLSVAAGVRGVQSVTSALEAYDTPDGVPSLQGQGTVAGPTLDILQSNWAPATQALVAAAGLAVTGAALAMYARR